MFMLTNYYHNMNMAVVIIIVLCLMVVGDAQVVLMLEKPRLMECKFDKIYQLGDSIADTGNRIRERFNGNHFRCNKLPYGMNFFQKATGRCSDGMLIVDFIALESGLPLLNPYKLPSANFINGVNFAVAGCTALPTEFLVAEKNFTTYRTNSSLNVQLDWMSSHFKCSSSDCRLHLKKSLFLVGEIGGNDFNHGFQQGKTTQELRSMIPQVVGIIIQGVRRVIGFGATRIVIPGNFPIGCNPIQLTQFMTNDSSAYDENHCLKDLNNFAIFYNENLQEAIDELKKEYPNITLIYGDYYNAYLWLLQNAVSLGFDGRSLLKACCGIGGDYNFGKDGCGDSGVPVCDDPTTHISWDGIHLTQAAYKWLARWLINDMLPKLNCQL